MVMRSVDRGDSRTSPERQSEVVASAPTLVWSISPFRAASPCAGGAAKAAAASAEFGMGAAAACWAAQLKTMATPAKRHIASSPPVLKRRMNLDFHSISKPQSPLWFPLQKRRQRDLA